MYRLLIIILILACACNEVKIKLFIDVPSKKDLGKDTIGSFFHEGSSKWQMDKYIAAKQYIFYNNKTNINGYWMMKDDTIFFSPIFFKEHNCMIKFPILVINWETDKDYALQTEFNDNIKSCFLQAMYFQVYYVKIIRVIEDGDDRLFSFFIYNSRKFEINYFPSNNKEIKYIYNDFLKNKKDFDFTKIDLSLKKGIINIDKQKVAKIYILPI